MSFRDPNKESLHEEKLDQLFYITVHYLRKHRKAIDQSRQK